MLVSFHGLLAHFDPGSMSLNVHGRMFKIVALDVTDLMVLGSGTKPFDFDYKSPFVRTFCKAASRHWAMDVKGIIDRLLGSLGDDFKSMYILLMLATMIYP